MKIYFQYEIGTKHSDKSLNEIKEFFKNEYDDVIDEYFRFLEEKEFGFWVDKDEAKYFPDLSMEWDMPNKITNAIIDCDKKSKHNFQVIFQQLEKLACYSLQLRYFSSISLSELNEVLTLLDKSCILSIEILIPHTHECIAEDLKLLIKKHPRITNLFIHSCKENQILINDIGKGNLIFTIQKIETNFQCGKISLKAFSINTLLFTESQAHNTCLNRKISIDVNGEIKNCPA